MFQSEEKRLSLNKGVKGFEETGEGRVGAIKRAVGSHLRSLGLYPEDSEKLCKSLKERN